MQHARSQKFLISQISFQSQSLQRSKKQRDDFCSKVHLSLFIGFQFRSLQIAEVPMPPPPQPTPVKPKAAAPTAEKKVVKQDPMKACSQSQRAHCFCFSKPLNTVLTFS